MPPQKLSPIWSRLSVSSGACALVLLLYLTLISNFAYASDVDSLKHEDHNHERLPSPHILDEELGDVELRTVGYQAQFVGVDRGIIGRAPSIDPMGLANNVPAQDNVLLGEVKQYRFLNASLWGPMAPMSAIRFYERSDESIGNEVESSQHDLRKRAVSTRTVYVTLNTCLQPHNPNDPTGALGVPAQLELYVSNFSSPGPDKPSNTQQMVVADGGFANITMQAYGDVFIAVAAKNSTAFTSGVYNIEVAASIDAPYHSFISSDPNLFFIDSDSTSALLATKSLPVSSNGTVIMPSGTSLPYVIFVNNNSDPFTSGLQNSYCALNIGSQIAGTVGGQRETLVKTSITDTVFGNFPKQQFYFNGLHPSSSYYGSLAVSGNSTASGAGVVGGGGIVWRSTNFTTQSGMSEVAPFPVLELTFTDTNCAMVFNLSFCDTVSYAVPGNPNTFSNAIDLANFYDNAAAALYQNFDNALQQIPCEIDPTSQYSLARNCTDCAAAYKAWLCSVTIPRCMDFSSTASWLQERNVVQAFPNGTMLDAAYVNASQNILYLNSSRNPNIDLYVQPGPYKEILPCDYLCYNLVQSCPSSMGFSCPLPGWIGFNHSYGLQPNGSAEQENQITCNYPGAAYGFSAGSLNAIPNRWAVATVVLLGLFWV